MILFLTQVHGAACRLESKYSNIQLENYFFFHLRHIHIHQYFFSLFSMLKMKTNIQNKII